MNNKQQLCREIYERCGEYLEMIPEEFWDQHLVPVLSNMLMKERELSSYYKKRLEVYERKEVAI